MPLIADFDQLLIGDLLDIVGAHALEHLAEQVELPVGLRSVLRGGAERAGLPEAGRLPRKQFCASSFNLVAAD